MPFSREDAKTRNDEIHASLHFGRLLAGYAYALINLYSLDVTSLTAFVNCL